MSYVFVLFAVLWTALLCLIFMEAWLVGYDKGYTKAKTEERRKGERRS